MLVRMYESSYSSSTAVDLDGTSMSSVPKTKYEVKLICCNVCARRFRLLVVSCLLLVVTDLLPHDADKNIV